MATTRKPATRRPAGSKKRARPARGATSKRTRPASIGGGIAPGMQAVHAFLAVANVGASAEFLERVVGLTRGVALADADGQLRYAEMRRGDTAVMLVRKGDDTTPTGGSAALYAYVDDVDAAASAAREAGAGVSEAHDQPWGDRTAAITDPDGYRWMLATFRKLVPFS